MYMTLILDAWHGVAVSRRRRRVADDTRICCLHIVVKLSAMVTGYLSQGRTCLVTSHPYNLLYNPDLYSHGQFQGGRAKIFLLHHSLLRRRFVPDLIAQHIK